VRLLTVRHHSIYRYARAVSFGEHSMMFRPRDSHGLRLLNSKLTISPSPRSIRWLHDVFDNSVAIASFDEAADELSFESTITLEHYEAEPLDYQLEPAARTFPFAYATQEHASLERALHRRYPSQDVADWARGFLDQAGSTETMGLLTSMTLATREQFCYVRRLERGTQTPSETFRSRTGSCRDFALFMIEAVRSLGFAARFVSGYIFVPDQNPSQSVGGGATHAWLQVYLPGAGWVDFDPTNSIVGNRNLIRVAVAWDPADVLPLWGTFTGSTSEFLGLEVNVRVVDETCEEVDGKNVSRKH
jgi:transglutaminase-like putative cysteine protease